MDDIPAVNQLVHEFICFGSGVELSAGLRIGDRFCKRRAWHKQRCECDRSAPD
jgi:hypothetical protein